MTNIFSQILDFVRSSKTYASILSSHCDDTQIVDVSKIEAQVFMEIFSSRVKLLLENLSFLGNFFCYVALKNLLRILAKF